MTEIPPTPPESRAFPWLKHLPEDARREFFEELSNALGEAQLRTMPGVLVSPETYLEVLEPLLASWKSTAEVHADPELYAALTAPVRAEDLVEAPRPVEPVKKPAKRCGASLPHENADDGWYWCILPMGHKGLHHEGDPSIGWQDGEVVEVYSTEDVRAVPSHIHDFVGDEDTCVADPACQLTWGGSCAQDTRWKASQESGVPLESWDTPLCPSNIPDPDKADSARWCVLPAGHEGDHRKGEHTWTDEDARRTFAEATGREWKGASADYEIVDEIHRVPQQREGDDG